MKSHFIKGTNQQYSIREDGVVISHKRKIDKIISSTIKKEQVYKAKIVCLYINGKQKNLRVETLLYNHFNLNICRDCGDSFTNSKRKYLCPCCKKEHNNINVKKWSDKNPSKKKQYTKNGNLKARQNLTDSYIRSVLKLSKEEATQELIELERTNIKLKRLLSSKLNVHINSFQTK